MGDVRHTHTHNNDNVQKIYNCDSCAKYCDFTLRFYIKTLWSTVGILEIEPSLEFWVGTTAGAWNAVLLA